MCRQHAPYTFSGTVECIDWPHQVVIPGPFESLDSSMKEQCDFFCYAQSGARIIPFVSMFPYCVRC